MVALYFLNISHFSPHLMGSKASVLRFRKLEEDWGGTNETPH